MPANLLLQQADPTLSESRVPEVIGSSIVFLILPTVAVILRLLSRWMAGVGLWVRSSIYEWTSVVDCENSGTTIP